jgi:DNA polymerase/3'-5' exonuclease PolX
VCRLVQRSNVSAGIGFPLAEARVAAEEVADLLRPATRRLAVAGSIRRKNPVVHDIEIVVEPAEQSGLDMWGELVKPAEDSIEVRVDDLIRRGVLRLRDVNPVIEGPPSYRNGPRYKALVYRDEFPIDLSIVRPPASWGVTLFSLTGPSDWNRRIATECQRHSCTFHDGQLFVMGQPVPTDEEEDVFEALGLEWLDPPERSAERVRWQGRQNQ